MSRDMQEMNGDINPQHTRSWSIRDRDRNDSSVSPARHFPTHVRHILNLFSAGPTSLPSGSTLIMIRERETLGYEELPSSAQP